MKILLLGKDGMLGTELRPLLNPLGNLITIGRSEFNLENLLGLNFFLNFHQPDIIVNAAAYTAVDKAENNKEIAFTLNADVVSILAGYTKKNNRLLIHYSTDYVFDGKKQGAYSENDPVNPQNIYGASKLAGEEAILQTGGKFVILRTSWLFSTTGKNFIKTILEHAKEKNSLRVVADQFGAPTSATFIANVTAQIISKYTYFFLHPNLLPNKPIYNNIYHLTSEGKTSWYDFACYIVDKALEKGMSLNLQSQNINAVTSNEYPCSAKRPVNSTLNTEAISKEFNLKIPNWTIHVDDIIEQLVKLSPNQHVK